MTCSFLGRSISLYGTMESTNRVASPVHAEDNDVAYDSEVSEVEERGPSGSIVQSIAV